MYSRESRMPTILSRRRDQIPLPTESTHESTRQEVELDAFQRNVAVRFHDLSSPESGELLSIPWLRNLLDAFLCCQEEFKVILHNNSRSLNKSPMDKHVFDYYERSVKALDVCNAIRDGIHQIKESQKLLEIVLCALDKDNQRSCVGEGQFRRAKKALVDLALGFNDDNKVSSASFSHRNRSFGRKEQREQRSLTHFRSLSWSVSRSWSAAKQLQAISNNFTAPKANEVTLTNGLNLAVFTMSYILFFVMWALVAAIPCHDRGLQTHFNPIKQLSWGGAIMALHERILEESKKRERRNAYGLLREIYEVEKCVRNLNELSDSVHFPLNEEMEMEVKQRVEEVRSVYDGLKKGVDPLERQVREVFQRIVRSRTEGLHYVGWK